MEYNEKNTYSEIESNDKSVKAQRIHLILNNTFLSFLGEHARHYEKNWPTTAKCLKIAKKLANYRLSLQKIVELLASFFLSI